MHDAGVGAETVARPRRARRVGRPGYLDYDSQEEEEEEEEVPAPRVAPVGHAAPPGGGARVVKRELRGEGQHARADGNNQQEFTKPLALPEDVAGLPFLADASLTVRFHAADAVRNPGSNHVEVVAALPSRDGDSALLVYTAGSGAATLEDVTGYVEQLGYAFQSVAVMPAGPAGAGRPLPPRMQALDGLRQAAPTVAPAFYRGTLFNAISPEVAAGAHGAPPAVALPPPYPLSIPVPGGGGASWRTHLVRVELEGSTEDDGRGTVGALTLSFLPGAGAGPGDLAVVRLPLRGGDVALPNDYAHVDGTEGKDGRLSAWLGAAARVFAGGRVFAAGEAAVTERH